MFAAGKPGLLVSGLCLPSAQPCDAPAPLTGNQAPPARLPRGPRPGCLCSTFPSVSFRAKMGMASPRLSPLEFHGHPQLSLLPPHALPPSSPLLTQRLRNSEPCTWSSMASSRSSAGPWRPCATSPRMSARSCWIRYQHPLCCATSLPAVRLGRALLCIWMLSGALAGHWNACLALQSLDLAEYNFLFALSFTTPTFDSEVAPSFGTLLATVNVALNMLGEVSWVLSGPSTQASVSLPDREPGHIYPAWACLVRDLPSKNLSVSWSYHCYLTFFLSLDSLPPARQEKGTPHSSCRAQHTGRRAQNTEVRKPSFWNSVWVWGSRGPAVLLAQWPTWHLAVWPSAAVRSSSVPGPS